MDAYADFIAEALDGPFRAPADGGYTAQQIVAHVARNHEELIAVTEAVLAGDEVTYDNREPTVRELDRYASGYGEGVAGLADRVAMTVTVLRVLAYQLEDRGTIRVRSMEGDPMPWAKVLELDETVHVPRRLGQLRALRG